MKDYYVSVVIEGRQVPNFFVSAENTSHAGSIAAAIVTAMSHKNYTFAEHVATDPNDPDEYGMCYIHGPGRIGSISICARITEEEYRRIWDRQDSGDERYAASFGEK